MKQSMEIMKNSILSILPAESCSLYLYGSAAMNDFKPGWSDIDIICFTNFPLSDEQAQTLLILRQTLLEKDRNNPYFRCFEGAFVSLEEFLTNRFTRVVYWGTSGQKITDRYTFDAFSRYELITDGILLHGIDIRSQLSPPSSEQLRRDVTEHYHTIRKYAGQTNGSLYSCGWLLDIARGIYTLRTGTVTAKTNAGEWALNMGICPVENDLRRTLLIRNDPLKYRDDPEVQAWLTSLGPAIQKFADVLQKEIDRTS